MDCAAAHPIRPWVPLLKKHAEFPIERLVGSRVPYRTPFMTQGTVRANRPRPRVNPPKIRDPDSVDQQRGDGLALLRLQQENTCLLTTSGCSFCGSGRDVYYSRCLLSYIHSGFDGSHRLDYGPQRAEIDPPVRCELAPHGPARLSWTRGRGALVLQDFLFPSSRYRSRVTCRTESGRKPADARFQNFQARRSRGTARRPRSAIALYSDAQTRLACDVCGSRSGS